MVKTNNDKSIKNYIVKTALPKMDNARDSELCWIGICQVCDHIITSNTFTIKACGEVVQIQSAPLNCNSEKVIYLLKCKIYDDTPYFRKAKTKFHL